MKRKLCVTLAAAASLAIGPASWAAEHAIGKHIKRNGMEIGAVYLQPVVMKPVLPGMNQPADVHLEADIHAL